MDKNNAVQKKSKKDVAKRVLKNSAKTIPKAAFRGSMHLGKGIFKAAGALSKNKFVRELAVLGLVAGASIAFAPELLMISATKGVIDKVVFNKQDVIAHEAKGMFHMMRDVARVPTDLVGDLLTEAARGGEKLTQLGLDATR